MLKIIIEREIKDIVSSTKFAVTFAVCVILILASFYVGAAHYNLNKQQYDASVAENLRQMEGLTEWYSVRQHKVFMPPQPLAALVTGISNDIGQTADMLAGSQVITEGSRYNEDPIFAVFRFLDLEFIFQIVLSLFAILLGYDAISGEKERGTLRLTFASNLPRRTYILGKLIGSFAALSSSLIVALGLGCLFLPMMGVPMSGDEWIRLLIIAGSGLLYFGVFLTGSLFVSAMTQRSSSSFLLLLVAWILAVMIIPRASVLTAARAVEVPSVDHIANQRSSLASQLWAESRDAMTNFKPDIDDDDPEAMMKIGSMFSQFMDSLGTIRNDQMSEFSDRINEERFNAQQIQQNLSFNLARISPSTSMKLATSNLAGTSLELTKHFRDETRAYHKVVGDFIREKTGMNPHGGMIIKINDGSEEPEPIDPSELPSFEYKPIRTATAINAALPDIGLLALFNFLFFTGAVISFGRYDVR